MSGWLIHAERPNKRSDGRWETAIQGHKGFPDIVMTRGPHLWFVELKRKPNRVEPDQELWIDRLDHIAPNVKAWVLWVPEEQDAFIKMLIGQHDAR